MTAQLIVRVNIDDIATRSLFNGPCGKTIAGEHHGEIRSQIGIVVPQMTELIACRNEFHSSTVVVVQHTVVIIDFHDILKFSIDQHCDGMTC